MRILLIGEAGWLGRHSLYTMSALTQIGHDVEPFWMDQILPAKLRFLQGRLNSPASRFVFVEAALKLLHRSYIQFINRKMQKAVAAFRPHAILALNGSQILPETWRQLREQGIVLVNWIGDDPFRFPRLIDGLRHFDHIYITDPIHLVALRLLLPNAMVETLSLAAEPKHFAPQELSEDDRKKYECDLLFVGSGYGGGPAGSLRALVLAPLVKRYDVKIFGEGWDALFQEFPLLKSRFYGPIRSADELNKAYNAARIVLVVHHPQCKLQTNQGPYEVSCAGGFTIAENKEEIVKVFGPNVACFETLAQADELVAYYLNNPELRQSKSRQSRTIVLENHTYLHRMNQLTNAIAESMLERPEQEFSRDEKK